MTTIQTPENIARVAAQIVGLDLGLAKLLSRDFEADFGGGSGSVVKVRVPGAVEASTRDARDLTTPLVQAALIEQSIPVELNTLAYSSVPLAAGHYDLDMTDYARQILQPQSSALVKYVERETVAALQATPETTSITFDEANPGKTFTAIRRQLRANGVGAGEPLLAAVGADVYAALLDAVPSTAGVTFTEDGKVRGFQVVESTRLAADEIVGFVRPAFALVVRAPKVPEGAPYGASVREDDFAVTTIRTFDPSTATDRSIVSALVAVKAMPLAVDQEDGTVDLVPNAGAVRVLTAA
jgi:hypothetical protein